MSWVSSLDARVRESGEKELSAASGWFYVAKLCAYFSVLTQVLLEPIFFKKSFCS